MGEQQPLALYVHIPFCKARCAYCDFNTYAGLSPLFAPYVRALVREVRMWGERLADGGPPVSVRTLYVGGGTPSLLPPPLLAQVLDACREAFRLLPDAEVSLEANPETVERENLTALRALGVNRLSLGLQSTHADELRLLGRRHTFEDAVRAVRAARQAGFDNLNLDLIYGLPGQTVARWQRSLERVLALEPEHLSAYSLTVEEGTPLYDRVAAGRLPPPDPDQAAEMYELAEGMLAEAGYVHYEISNWARLPRPPLEGPALSPVREPSPFVCRHNLVYWRNEPYLGVGAGAHSSLEGRRWHNVLAPAHYIACLEAGELPIAQVEELSPEMAMAETMILGLRLLVEGVSCEEFRRRFGRHPLEQYGEAIEGLVRVGLLTVDGDRIRLTARGRLLGNEVFIRFLPEG